MSRFLILGLVTVLISLAVFAVVRRIQSAGAGEFKVVSGRHFVPPQLDPDAVGAAAVQRVLGPFSLNQAERAARRAVREHPASAGAHYNLGVVLFLRGRRDEALREYHQALARDPLHRLARDALTLVEELSQGTESEDRQ